ncbi:hypothetical protein B0I35DRAFT_446379 [Stachybotrys elegans]|uniref:Uncharacterized protein n=1 Tax=Stachybotrys elegans TaxID=80388 RepID=A0A8K0SDG0_9HYPO|nr:hypothetical protein B0I35DRAFT_446379 [Stachybotrys elegans]
MATSNLAAGANPFPPLKAFSVLNQSLGHLKFGMQATGHHKWGFVIFRTTYSNQKNWEMFMSRLREGVSSALDIYGCTAELEPFLQWTIIENAESLDSATKGHVRDIFRNWVLERSVQRDGSGVDCDPRLLMSRVPRYRLCLMVDDACLESLVDETLSRAVVINGEVPDHVAARIDEHEDEPDSEDTLDESELVPGSEDTQFWMFMHIDYLVSLYQEASWRSEWEQMYRQPPSLYEGH